jgi:protein-disulfide isomerase
MKMNWFNRIILFLILFFSVISANAGEITINDDQLREIIKQVIKDNPKLIYDTINKYIKGQRAEQQKKQLEASFKNRVKDGVEAHNPSKGDANAPITIIEYTDFECPYCARGAKTLDKLMKLFPDKIRIVFKNLPLKRHAQALPAAKAALAANNQGKFWEYHDLLFKNSANLNEEIIVQLAKDMHLDMTKFNADRQSEVIAQAVAKDMKDAKKLNFTGTPAFIANGVVIRGAKPVDYFAEIIDRLLQEQQ